jgi:hypothetical protein
MKAIYPDNERESWRDVVGFEGLYRVSDRGRVQSLERRRLGDHKTVPAKILTPILNKGYPRVTMRRDGKTWYKFAHQMVAEAFLGRCPDGQEVRHKNGNRADPRLENIEYGTRAQNIADCKQHGTFRNGASHLTEEIVRQIAARHDDTSSILAAEFNISMGTINNIRSGRVWKHLNLPLRKDYRRRGSEHPARRGKQLVPNPKP